MDLKEYLIKEPRARLRRNKNRAIGNIIIKKYAFKECEKEMMADMVGEILSMDRQWRKILEENPDLRGSDYAQKTELEIKKQEELGYGQTP